MSDTAHQSTDANAKRALAANEQLVLAECRYVPGRESDVASESILPHGTPSLPDLQKDTATSTVHASTASWSSPVFHASLAPNHALFLASLARESCRSA